MWVAMSFLGGLFKAFVPAQCLLCGRPGAEAFCERCRADVKPLAEPLCRTCGLPVIESPDGRCAACRSSRPPYAMARGAAVYDGPLKTAIHLLKAKGEKRLVEPLVQMMADWVAHNGGFEKADIIVPVPLHAKKERSRGFNQAQLLASALAARLKVPLEAKAVVKVRATPAQSSISLEDRVYNLQGVFAVPSADVVKWKRVLVVDDVMSTGSTLAEVAAALKAAGASDIYCFCAARELVRRPHA